MWQSRKRVAAISRTRGLVVAIRRGRMRAVFAAAFAVIGVVRPAVADDLRPAMSPDRPIQCGRDRDGHLWRIQCDAASKVCLYAPNDELDDSGRRTKPLDRARLCPVLDDSFDRSKLEAQGYRLIAGIPDAPWGWMRDDRGRVFQTSFDLKRRLYLGASYSPEWAQGSAAQTSRLSANFGLLSWEHFDGDNRHRVRLVEGEVHLEPFSAELVLAHYELSRRFVDPLLRITTFYGTPQRHDLHLNLGMWTEAGRMEAHRTSAGDSYLWRFGSAQLILDLWQSARLDSYARLRGGVGIDRQYTDIAGNRSAIVPAAAFEVDTVLDNGGFHNVRFELSEEFPQYFLPLPNAATYAHRLRAKVQYETILLAINDQPVSFNVAAGSEKRNDLPGVTDQWAFVMDAGLRYSLWAPPRPR
jgi:hypothetical protein